MSTETPDPELTALARALAALTPASGRLNRELLLFRAGQISARRRRWFWPSATAVLATVLATLGLAALLQPPLQTVTQVVYVRVEAAPISPSEPANRGMASDSSATENEERWRRQAAYVHLQQQLLRRGLDGLPGLAPAAPAPRPQSLEKFLNSL